MGEPHPPCHLGCGCTRRLEARLKAEARQLRSDFEAQRQASGGQLTDAQKDQFRQRKQELRAKVKAAMKATAPQDV